MKRRKIKISVVSYAREIVADCLVYNKSKTNRFFEMLFSPAAARRVAPQLARVRSVVCSLVRALVPSDAVWCALVQVILKWLLRPTAGIGDSMMM